MRVVIVDWRGAKRETDLDIALVPDVSYDGGLAEYAKALALKNSEVIGALAALLVEKKIITLDEATSACQVLRTIELKD